MSEGRNKVAELEALLDDRASEIERLRAALHRIMAEITLCDDDREPDIDLMFDTARKALGET